MISIPKEGGEMWDMNERKTCCHENKVLGMPKVVAYLK